MTPVIEVEDLVKHYGGLEAVRGISFSVEAGRIFGLIGPNGAGKTTIIKTLTGQLQPTSGGASVLGVNPVADPVGVRARLGIIPEQEAPPSFLTADEYFGFIASVRGLGDIDERKNFWFDLLDFAGQSNMLCKDLSRGNRQKLMVAQAFLHEPTLVFIDEPLVNLDPLIQKRVKDFFRDYVAKENTIFLCTHLLEIAEELCDEVAIIDRGDIVARGTLKDILEESAHLSDAFLTLVEEHHAGHP